MVLSPDLGRTKGPGPSASSSPGMQLGPGRDQSGMQVRSGGGGGGGVNAVCTARLSCADGSPAHRARLTGPCASSFDIPALPWGSHVSPSCPPRCGPRGGGGEGEWRVQIHSHPPPQPSSVPRFQHLLVPLSLSQESEREAGERREIPSRVLSAP